MMMVAGFFVFTPSAKSRFFVIYFKGVTLADRTAFPQGKPWLHSFSFRATISPTKARVFYAQNFIRLPWQSFSQVTDAKLCKQIPKFARFSPHLYYSHTTFEKTTFCPNMTRNNTAADLMVGGYLHIVSHMYATKRKTI